MSPIFFITKMPWGILDYRIRSECSPCFWMENEFFT